MSNKVLIIGGGASGLMAAISAAKRGCEVTIIEHGERVGKKILSTGNGKCNITNTDLNEKKYHGGNREFIKKVIEEFNVQDTMDFFQSLGVLLKNKNGYIYPESEQAATILNVLRFKCQELKITTVCNKNVKNILVGHDGFLVEGIKANCLIIATGGMSSPKTGSDGSGFSLIKSLGHKVIKPVPALVGLKCREGFYKALGGVRTTAKISLFVDDKLMASESGEIQLTEYGISGIPVFQISRFATRSFGKTDKIYAVIDFLPEIEHEDLMEFLNRSISNNLRTPEEHLSCILNKKLAGVILKETNISEYLNLNDISEIVNKIKKFKTDIIGSNSFENAQVTAGGVDLKEINPITMESKLVKNLYFAGEVMDVDGICGGYNLQWAWSTGYIAGKNAGRKG